MSVAVPPAEPLSRPSLAARLPWSTLLALADQVAVSGTSFLTTLVLGRCTSAEELGQYTLGFTLVVLLIGVFESLLTIPYAVYSNRRSEAERRVLAGSVLVHHAALTVLAVGFLAATAGLLSLGGKGALSTVVLVLAGLAPLLLLRELARRFSFAEHDSRTAFAVDAVVAVVQSAGLLGLLWLGWLTAVTAHVAAGLGSGLAGLAWLLCCRGRFRVEAAQVVADARQHWAFGKWVVAGQAVGITHGYAVHWLLLLLGDSAATGVYTACLTVLLLANPFLFGMGNVLGPRAARASAQEGVAGARRVVRQGMLLFAGVMTVFCGTIVVFAGPILGLFYGDRYAGQEAVVRVLAGAVFLAALGMAVEHGLRALERAKAAFRMGVLGLVVTCLAAASLIPTWGVLGASAGYLLGSAVGSLGRYLLLPRPEKAEVSG